jgi:hypothetical protein
MSITIKHHKAPDLARPRFTVDGELDPKLNKFEITSLMNRSTATVFLGRAGSGKSSLLISLIKTKSLFYKTFHTILLYMPQNSRQSIKDSFFDKMLPANQIYDDVTLDNLHEGYDIAQANARDGYNTLVIFDDVQSYLKGECEKFLLHILNNRRHARLSCFFACQTYHSIPRQVRQGITDLFVFKVSKVEMQNIFNELFETQKDRFIDILQHVFQKPHDFMYLNTNSQRMFSNWDELLIES